MCPRNRGTPVGTTSGSLSQPRGAAVVRDEGAPVGGVERGERNLGLINAAALARALDVELSVLMIDAEARMLATE